MRLSTSTWNQYYCLLSLLIVCGNIQSAVSEITFVQRLPGGDFKDVFGFVSPNQCVNTIIKAGQKDGSADQCKCHSSFSTFLFSRKACVANSVTKGILFDNSDCSELLRLQGQHREKSPYIVLDLQKGSKTFNGNQVKRITGRNCKVDNTLYYIDDQTGKQKSVNAGNVFSIDKGRKKLKWKSLPQTSKLHGRVLGLVPTSCTFSTSVTRSVNKPCIILKAEGSVTFSTPVISPTATLHPIPSTQAVTTITPSHNVSPTAAKQEDKQSSPVGAIVGSLMAVIAIVVIIVVIVMWKRRKNTSGQNNKPKGPNTPENPTYGNGSEIIDLSKQKQAAQNTDNDFEYDYAAVDGDPRSSSNAAPGIYQSLTKDPNQESVYTPLDQQQGNASDQSTGYEKVEHPVFQPARKGPTDPLYNILERPNGNNHDYMEPGVNIDKAPQNNEPVYNVLEGPAEDPDYNVLEDPNEQYEPEYNVLEGPCDNVPVDGHDNVGYTSTIDLKSGGAPNGPIYAAPEGPISEPTYQPLNVNGPDENVYQPLDRKSRVVPDDQPLYHVLESKTGDA